MKKMWLIAGVSLAILSSGRLVSAVTFEEALAGRKVSSLIGSDVRFTQQDTISTVLASCYSDYIINMARGIEDATSERLVEIRQKFLVETIRNEIQNEKRLDSIEHLIVWVERMYGRTRLLGKTVDFRCPDQSSAFIPVFQEAREVIVFAKNHSLASPELRKQADKKLAQIDFITGKLKKRFNEYYQELLEVHGKARK